METDRRPNALEDNGLGIVEQPLPGRAANRGRGTDQRPDQRVHGQVEHDLPPWPWPNLSDVLTQRADRATEPALAEHVVESSRAQLGIAMKRVVDELAVARRQV